jgi:hypothetical protein
MKDKEVRPKTSTVSSKSVTIKKGSSSVTPLEVKTSSARDRLDGVLEAERFRLSSLVASLALIIVFSAIILVICCILIASFKLPLLTMASENFRAAPVIMVIASCLSIGTRTPHNSYRSGGDTPLFLHLFSFIQYVTGTEQGRSHHTQFTF